ncbi:hypothetical protein OH77DRAFT_1439349 [Trametes cingulata]|nr:hypothetical protein OH77DRAFT_1439349 [Trametes cingulata]
MAGDLDRTVGALLLGILVTSVYVQLDHFRGYGITTMQTYMYAGRFPQDPQYIRWTVWVLFALDTAHIAFSWHMIYYYVIINFKNDAALEGAVCCPLTSMKITIIITAIITTIVHCFYAGRVFVFGETSSYSSPQSHSKLQELVPGLHDPRPVHNPTGFNLKTFPLIQHNTVVSSPLEAPPQPERSDSLGRQATVSVGLGSGTMADCVITASLVYLLRRHKSGFNLVVGVTFLVTVSSSISNTGGASSDNSAQQFSPMPFNMVFIALHLLLSKLYANSLLATLNFRDAHRGRGFHTDSRGGLNLTNVLRRADPPANGTAIVFCSTKDNDPDDTRRTPGDVGHSGVEEHQDSRSTPTFSLQIDGLVQVLPARAAHSV